MREFKGFAQTNHEILVAYLWERADWVPTHELVKLSRLYGFVGSAGDVRARAREKRVQRPPQSELQNRCGEPPLRRSNSPSHQRQIGFTAAAAIRPASPSIMCFPQFARVPFSAPQRRGRERKHSTRTRIFGHRRRLRLTCGAGYARNLWPLERRADRYCHDQLQQTHFRPDNLLLRDLWSPF